MLVALLTIILLGGGAFGPMIFIDAATDNAKAEIVDADRRKKIVASLKTMKKRSREYIKAARRLAKDLGKEYDAHAVDTAGADEVWDRFVELNAIYTADIIEMRFELRDQTSREEWSKLFPISEQ